MGLLLATSYPRKSTRSRSRHIGKGRRRIIKLDCPRPELAMSRFLRLLRGETGEEVRVGTRGGSQDGDGEQRGRKTECFSRQSCFVYLSLKGAVLISDTVQSSRECSNTIFHNRSICRIKFDSLIGKRTTLPL
jgi:hypothetical protein